MDELERWEAAGGTWRLEAINGDLVRILLCRCDGGEVVDVIETTDPEVIRWAQGIRGSAQSPE